MNRQLVYSALGVSAALGLVWPVAATPGSVDFSGSGVLRAVEDTPITGFGAVVTPPDPLSDPNLFFDPEMAEGPAPAAAPLPTAGGLGLVGLGLLAARRRRR